MIWHAISIAAELLGIHICHCESLKQRRVSFICKAPKTATTSAFISNYIMTIYYSTFNRAHPNRKISIKWPNSYNKIVIGTHLNLFLIQCPESTILSYNISLKRINDLVNAFELINPYPIRLITTAFWLGCKLTGRVSMCKQCCRCVINELSDSCFSMNFYWNFFLIFLSFHVWTNLF